MCVMFLLAKPAEGSYMTHEEGGYLLLMPSALCVSITVNFQQLPVGEPLPAKSLKNTVRLRQPWLEDTDFFEKKTLLPAFVAPFCRAARQRGGFAANRWPGGSPRSSGSDQLQETLLKS